MRRTLSLISTLLILAPIVGVLPASATSELEPLAEPTGQINVAPVSAVAGFETGLVYFYVFTLEGDVVHESEFPTSSLQLTVPTGEYFVAEASRASITSSAASASMSNSMLTPLKPLRPS